MFINLRFPLLITLSGKFTVCSLLRLQAVVRRPSHGSMTSVSIDPIGVYNSWYGITSDSVMYPLLQVMNGFNFLHQQYTLLYKP